CRKASPGGVSRTPRGSRSSRGRPAWVSRPRMRALAAASDRCWRAAARVSLRSSATATNSRRSDRSNCMADHSGYARGFGKTEGSLSNSMIARRAPRRDDASSPHACRGSPATIATSRQRARAPDRDTEMIHQAPDRFQEMRDALRDLCAEVPDEYHRQADADRAYPDAFADALTKQ